MRGPMAGSTAEPLIVRAWPLMVEELLEMRRRGLTPAVAQPEALARALADAERRFGPASADGGGGGGGEEEGELREALLSLPPASLRGGAVKLEVELEAPMWRLSAAYPAAAGESGGGLPCVLRAALPPGYPLAPPTERSGGSLEVAAPGALGREAARIVSRAAHVHVSGLAEAAGWEEAGGSTAAPSYLLAVADWVEGTELHELAAASFQPPPPSAPGGASAGRVRAFVRFHHVASLMKRCYMRMWAEDLGISALLAAGQPAMLLAEGPRGALHVFLERATKALHWGPTPARLVASSAVDGKEAAPEVGLLEVREAYPETVTPQGTYNGRDAVDFASLAAALQRSGRQAAAEELRRLLVDGGGGAGASGALAVAAFAHVAGRVAESADGSGWVGYRLPEPKLAEASPPSVAAAAAAAAGGTTKAPVARRWGRSQRSEK